MIILITSLLQLQILSFVDKFPFGLVIAIFVMIILYFSNATCINFTYKDSQLGHEIIINILLQIFKYTDTTAKYCWRLFS